MFWGLMCCYCFETQRSTAIGNTVKDSNAMHYSLIIGKQNEIEFKVQSDKNFSIWSGSIFSDFTYFLSSNEKNWRTTPTDGFSGIFYYGSAQKPIVLPIPSNSLEEKLGIRFSIGKSYDFYAITKNGEKTNILHFMLVVTKLNPREDHVKDEGTFNLMINVVNKEDIPWIKISVANSTDTIVPWQEGAILKMFYFSLEKSSIGGGAWTISTAGSRQQSDLKSRPIKPKETIVYEMKLDDFLKQVNISLQKSNYIRQDIQPGNQLNTYCPVYRLGISTHPFDGKTGPLEDYANVEFLVLFKECKE